MSTVFLAEVDVVSPAGVAAVLRFSDRAIAPFPPTDPDRPNAQFDDRLVEPPTLRRALFDDLASLSAGLGVGAMRLSNADRKLSPYKAWSWGEARVWRWQTGTPFSAAIQVLQGLTATPGFTPSGKAASQVTVPLYDYRAELEGPLQSDLYAGTNGAPGVLYEGEADGLKGRVKPLAYGRLEGAHLPAPQVNAAVLGHQLHDGLVQGSVEIFDRGDAAGFADQGALVGAAFDAFTPSPASWCRDLGRGLVKINGSAAGVLSFGCRGDATGGYVETTGGVLSRLLAKAGVPPARIGASVAALASSAPIGAWFGETTSARDAVAWVTRSAPAALLPDRQGVWTAMMVTPPALVADHALGEDEIIDMEADETAPPPVGEIRVGYGRIWTTFNGSEIAPALRGTSAEARLASEYRWATVVDDAAKARFPRTWRTLELTTALREEADALALATTLKGLFGLRPDGKARQVWRATIELTPARLALPLGATVAVDYPPNDIDDHFILLGEEPMRPRRDQVLWSLWG